MKNIKEFWSSKDYMTFAQGFDTELKEIDTRFKNGAISFEKSVYYSNRLLEVYHLWLFSVEKDTEDINK